MTFYIVTTLLTTVSYLGLGLFVFFQNPRRFLYRIFLIFCSSVAFWALGYFITLLPNINYQTAIIASRCSHAVGAFIPVTFLHFTLTFLKIHQGRIKLLIVSYVISAVMCIAALTPLVVSDVIPKMEIQYYPEKGVLYLAYVTLYLIFAVGFAHFYLLRAYVRTKGVHKTRLIFFMATSALGFVGGVSLFLLIFNIPFPPYASALIVVYPFAMSYSIIKYREFDIEVIIKKTLVFAGIVAAAVAVVAFPFALIQAVIGKALGVPDPFILMALGIATAVLIYRPIEHALVDITDRYLFQKKKEIKVVLKNLSEKVSAILDLKQIGQTILSTLVEAFRLESGVMVVYDNKEQTYRLLENSGLPPEDFVQSVRQYFNHADIQEYFKNHRDIVSVDNPDSDRLPENVSEWINRTKGRVCIPLFIDEEQNGFMLLGKKKSDQEFTQEEMDYFPTIESQVSLAIQKARLLENVVEEREAKVQAEHLAKRVKFAGLIKHEIQNKLVHIQMPANATSTYCIPRLKKWFKEQNEKRFSEICDEVAKGSKDINLAADHIRIIALTARSGVDESNKSFEESDFKLIWEDAKEESGLLKRCDFESKIPQRFYVYANFHTLQRTLVNLIRNAFDAMKNNDKPLIRLRCSYENIEGKNVAYFELEDSGCGIPEGVQNKIFEDGFSTKPKPDAKDLLSSGHGQGLAACKLYIENIHNGKIWFETETGKGTIFKFWVPMSAGETQSQG